MRCSVDIWTGHLELLLLNFDRFESSTWYGNFALRSKSSKHIFAWWDDKAWRLKCVKNLKVRTSFYSNWNTLLCKPRNMVRQAIWLLKWYLVIWMCCLRACISQTSFYSFRYARSLQMSHQRHLPLDTCHLFKRIVDDDWTLLVDVSN